MKESMSPVGAYLIVSACVLTLVIFNVSFWKMKKTNKSEAKAADVETAQPVHAAQTVQHVSPPRQSQQSRRNDPQVTNSISSQSSFESGRSNTSHKQVTARQRTNDTLDSRSSSSHLDSIDRQNKPKEVVELMSKHYQFLETNPLERKPKIKARTDSRPAEMAAGLDTPPTTPVQKPLSAPLGPSSAPMVQNPGQLNSRAPISPSTPPLRPLDYQQPSPRGPPQQSIKYQSPGNVHQERLSGMSSMTGRDDRMSGRLEEQKVNSNSRIHRKPPPHFESLVLDTPSLGLDLSLDQFSSSLELKNKEETPVFSPPPRSHSPKVVATSPQQRTPQRPSPKPFIMDTFVEENPAPLSASVSTTVQSSKRIQRPNLILQKSQSIDLDIPKHDDLSLDLMNEINGKIKLNPELEAPEIEEYQRQILNSDHYELETKDHDHYREEEEEEPMEGDKKEFHLEFLTLDIEPTISTFRFSKLDFFN